MRHFNLKLLFARTDFKGSPKSEHVIAQLKNDGVNLTPAALSDLFWEKQEISNNLVAAIESAFHLPAGWMDQRNSIIFELNERDLSDVQLLLSQKTRVRESLRSLLLAIPQLASAETPRS